MRIGLQSRLYNAEVRNRRLALGLTQKELGIKVGCSDGQLICGVECLRITAAQSPIITKLSAFFGVDPETLCPPWLSMMKEVPTIEDRQAEFDKGLVDDLAARKFALPDVSPATQEMEADRTFVARLVSHGLQGLSAHEANILRLSFGIAGVPQRADREISETLGIGLQTVRIARRRALSKLKRGNFGKRLGAQLADGDGVPALDLPIKRRLAMKACLMIEVELKGILPTGHVEGTLPVKLKDLRASIEARLKEELGDARLSNLKVGGFVATAEVKGIRVFDGGPRTRVSRGE